MTELSDYKRLVEEPHLRQMEERAAEQRGMIRDLTAILEKRNAALREIADAPYTMVNDFDSLRHSIRSIQQIALNALGQKR